METLLIQTEDKSTQKLLIAFAKKLGNKVKIIDNSITEDFIFGKMMQEAKTGINVSKDTIVELLNK